MVRDGLRSDCDLAGLSRQVAVYILDYNLVAQGGHVIN